MSCGSKLRVGQQVFWLGRRYAVSCGAHLLEVSVAPFALDPDQSTQLRGISNHRSSERRLQKGNTFGRTTLRSFTFVPLHKSWPQGKLGILIAHDLVCGKGRNDIDASSRCL